MGFGQFLASLMSEEVLGKGRETKQLHLMLPSSHKQVMAQSLCPRHPEPGEVSVCLGTVSGSLGVCIHFLPDPCEILPVQCLVVSRFAGLARYCGKTYSPMEQCNSAQ